MGLRSIGPLLIIFLIIIFLFGTEKLRSLGSDLGAAVKNFRKGMQEGSGEKNE